MCAPICFEAEKVVSIPLTVVVEDTTSEPDRFHACAGCERPIRHPALAQVRVLCCESEAITMFGLVTHWLRADGCTSTDQHVPVEVSSLLSVVLDAIRGDAKRFVAHLVQTYDARRHGVAGYWRARITRLRAHRPDDRRVCARGKSTDSLSQ